MCGICGTFDYEHGRPPDPAVLEQMNATLWHRGPDGGGVHLDGPADTVGDGLIRAGAEDVLLAISINPYARHSLELAELAREKGLGIIAITDSEVSPLVGIADQAILCSTESQSFFHTLAPALAISEVLCGLLANKDRNAALAALHRADRHLLSLNTYATAIPRRKI